MSVRNIGNESLISSRPPLQNGLGGLDNIFGIYRSARCSTQLMRRFLDDPSGAEGHGNKQDCGEEKEGSHPEGSGQKTPRDRADHVAEEKAAAGDAHDPPAAFFRGVQRRQGVKGGKNTAHEKALDESKDKKLVNLRDQALGSIGDPRPQKGNGQGPFIADIDLPVFPSRERPAGWKSQ